MNIRVAQPLDIDALVEHMFEQVLDADERAELLIWIKNWDAANPDADAAHRVTGWIDVAYAFQARIEGRVEGHAPARVLSWLPTQWSFA